MMLTDDINKLTATASKIRKNILKAAYLAGSSSSHFGGALSSVDLLTTLYFSEMNLSKSNVTQQNRDRFILSKGHGCLALYSILADKNFFDKKLLETFCKTDSIFGGHPEIYKVPGVEATTGALGHGLSIASGIALALKLEKKTQKVVTVVGDGEINEGSIWEALLSISKHQLSNLLIIIDYNKMNKIFIYFLKRSLNFCSVFLLDTNKLFLSVSISNITAPDSLRINFDIS